MKKTELQYVFKVYLSLFVLLILVLALAIYFLPLQNNFLGGGKVTYMLNPYFWVWANFDGEHYTSIARLGYGFGQYPFFPLYPLMIEFFGKLFGNNLRAFVASGILISHASFILALVGFYKLLRMDYTDKFTKTVLLVTILFPTSFYFLTIYTESLFLALSIWAVYFARRGNWLIASLLGIALTATRFVGIIILPTILMEWLIQRRSSKNMKFPEIIFAIPVGLFSYMYYLEKHVQDMFAFFNNLTLFGEQRSAHLITLPQVFYRYLFKILPNLNTIYFPIIYTTILEFAVGIVFLLLSILGFFRLRLSYSMFLLLGYLIPTFSGSFSSLPRYVLVLFPAYILISQLIHKSPKKLFVFYLASFILLSISFALFARGYWLS